MSTETEGQANIDEILPLPSDMAQKVKAWENSVYERAAETQEQMKRARERRIKECLELIASRISTRAGDGESSLNFTLFPQEATYRGSEHKVDILVDVVTLLRERGYTVSASESQEIIGFGQTAPGAKLTISW